MINLMNFTKAPALRFKGQEETPSQPAVVPGAAETQQPVTTPTPEITPAIAKDTLELSTTKPTVPTEPVAPEIPTTPVASVQNDNDGIPEFTRQEATNLLSLGLIGTFNERIEQWRQKHPDPKEFFDLKNVKMAELLSSAQALSSLNPQQGGDTIIDFIGVDLSGADFTGLATLDALFTEEPEEGRGSRDTLLEGAKFSLTTIKVMT